MCALAVGYSIVPYYLIYKPSVDLLDSKGNFRHSFAVSIDDVISHSDNGGTYNVSLIQCDGDSLRTFHGSYPQARLSSFYDCYFEKNDIVHLNAVLASPKSSADGSFDEQRYLKSKGIFLCLDEPLDAIVINKDTESFSDVLRGKMADGLNKYIGIGKYEDEAYLARCMLLGEKSSVPKELKESFKVAGVSHILSVSGLHLSVLLGFISNILMLIFSSKRRRFPLVEFICCPIALLYMAVTSFTPSIMRAGFMLIIMQGINILRYYLKKMKDPFEDAKLSFDYFDSTSSLFCAAVLICIISPYSVFDIGMQLSFMSTLGILCCLYIFKEFLKKLPWILRFLLSSVLITFSAVSFTFPICVYNFGALSTMAFISNLIIAPIITPLLVILLIIALFSLLSALPFISELCGFLGLISHFMLRLCMEIIEFLSKFLYAILIASDNFTVDMFYLFFVTAAVLGVIFASRKTAILSVSALVCLYLGCNVAYFINTSSEYNSQRVKLFTVKEQPYICALYRDNRIVFTSGESIPEPRHLYSALSKEHYDITTFYVVVPFENSDPDKTYSGIIHFNDYEKIDHLLLPSSDVYEQISTDTVNFEEMRRKLIDDGFRISYYNSKFSVGEFKAETSFEKEGTIISFGNKSIVFSDSYIPSLAAEAAENKEKCFYFCHRALKINGFDYAGDAELYVTSAVAGKIGGAEKIPTRKPMIFAE